MWNISEVKAALGDRVCGVNSVEYLTFVFRDSEYLG